MPAEALDMALDDLVQGGRGRGRGKGKSGGGKSWGKGSGETSNGRGKGARKGGFASRVAKASTKVDGDKALDMSLEEVIEKTKGGGKGKRQEKGKGRSKGYDNEKGKGKSSWGNDSYSKGRGKSWDGGYNKGGGKGWKDRDSYDDRKGYKGSGKGYYGKDRGGSKGYDDRATAWSEHDDRDDDFGPSSFGSRGGKGRSESSFGGPSRVRETGGWQRVEQDRAPIRDSDRYEAPARRREERAPMRGSKREAEESRGPPTKRRATEDAPGARTCKSIKVTNIPKNVNMQDIKDAFEQETGKIGRCRLDRGTAWIAFATSSAARKAVDTFDRGELNGQTIGVVLDF